MILNLLFSYNFQYSNAECIYPKRIASDRVDIDKYGISISFDSSKKIDGSGYREVDCVDSGCSPYIKCYIDNVISKYSKWNCFPKNNGELLFVYLFVININMILINLH